jgi:hypothetical protein
MARSTLTAISKRSRRSQSWRFATLRDVVNHYDAHFGLLLTERGKGDLVEYLKSL